MGQQLPDTSYTFTLRLSLRTLQAYTVLLSKWWIFGVVFLIVLYLCFIFIYPFHTVVWNPWDKKAKQMADFGDDEYKHMLCVEAAAVEKPITLKPGEEWKGRQELSAVPSSYCSGQLDPRKVLLSS